MTRINFDAIFRDDAPKARATLIRILRHFDLAEDVLQDALTRAMKLWPETGVPDNPAAWLVTAGRNRAIDIFRRSAKEREIVADMDVEEALDEDELLEAATFRDDMPRLIFTCCHPALSLEARLALTLKTVAGFSVEEIARAFLIPPKTMEQRLTRAKKKIAAAAILYEIPASQDLPERLDTVLLVVYLLFNEGYTATSGVSLIRRDLCAEGIRLARTLRDLFNDEPEVMGLYALLILQDEQREARVADDGSLVPLEDQDRSKWNREAIAEGEALDEAALRKKRAGPYQIQAAIAALHCEAENADAADWAQIAALYEVLYRFMPTPVVQLNKAVARGMADGPDAGLALLEEIAATPEMESYHLFYSTKGAFLERADRIVEVSLAFEKAHELATNPAEKDTSPQKLRKITHKPLRNSHFLRKSVHHGVGFQGFGTSIEDSFDQERARMWQKEALNEFVFALRSSPEGLLCRPAR